ncbi:MAG TPA: FAD:protein FMN transferase [Myxococcota bacterium]|nr:FAD:protein FMN transferase [Myxococcota bacterium]
MILLFSVPAWAEFLHQTRPAMGSLVGISLNSEAVDANSHVEAAFAEIESWEAQLSEWRPQSLSGRMNAGEKVSFPAEAEEMFAVAEQLRLLSAGAFSLTWRGGELRSEAGVRWVEGGKVDLGGILKGFLVDRAIEKLEELGEHHFLIDAAGDIGARGNAPGQRGWPVTVDLYAYQVDLSLRNASLSTSSPTWQPGHIRDARSGAEARRLRAVTVVAPRGVEADALATATFASGSRLPWPESRVLWEEDGVCGTRLRGDRAGLHIRRRPPENQ